MKALSKVGRIIYAIPFIIFGLFHFMNTEQMASNLLADWPMNNLIVIITGLLLVFSGITILINKLARTGAILLAVFLLGTIVLIHIPASMNDPMNMTNLLKDLAMLGAALTYAGLLKK